MDVSEELDCSYLTFKDLEQSLERTVLETLSSHRNGDVRVASKSFAEVEHLQHKTGQFTPECMNAVEENWLQDSTPLSPCTKFGRSLSGLSIRRSLVGSFEESLLSGRIASGIVNQVRVHISLSWKACLCMIVELSSGNKYSCILESVFKALVS